MTTVCHSMTKVRTCIHVTISPQPCERFSDFCDAATTTAQVSFQTVKGKGPILVIALLT